MEPINVNESVWKDKQGLKKEIAKEVITPPRTQNIHLSHTKLHSGVTIPSNCG